MEKIKNKIPKKALAFASALIIVLSLFSTIAFAQAFDGSFDITDSPTVVVTAYPTEANQYNFDKPLFQYIANGWEYVPPDYTNSSANGFSVVFYRDFYEKYTFDDILTTRFTYSIILLNRTSTTAGSFNNFDYYGSLQNAIDEFRFPTADIAFEQLSNAYYEQFSYWENQISNAYNEGKSLGYQSGYTQSLLDYDSFENGLFAIFQSPFVFVQNITTLDVFGISLIDVVTFVIVLCLGFVLIKFIGGALPL